jgi:hypothetical protein
MLSFKTMLLHLKCLHCPPLLLASLALGCSSAHTPPAPLPKTPAVAVVEAESTPPLLRLTIEHKTIGHPDPDDFEMVTTQITLLEGDPKNPTSRTIVGESIGTCSAQDAAAGSVEESKDEVLLFLTCWWAGMGRDVTVWRRGQTVLVETRATYEELGLGEEEPVDVVWSRELPLNTPIDVQALHPSL